MGGKQTRLELVDDPFYDIAIFICGTPNHLDRIAEYRILIGCHSKYTLNDIPSELINTMLVDSTQYYKKIFSSSLSEEEYNLITHEIDGVRGLFYAYKLE